jgi:hypothetical protein
MGCAGDEPARTRRRKTMRWVIGLVITGFVVLVTFGVLAVSFRQPAEPLSSYSHPQLQAQTTLGENGMFQHLGHPGYVWALEQHANP